jgi:pre-mRNA-splicing factor CWC26
MTITMATVTSTSSRNTSSKSGYLAKYLDDPTSEDDREERHSKKRKKDKKNKKSNKKHKNISSKPEFKVLQVHDSDEDDGNYRKNGDYEDEDDEMNEEDNPIIVNAKEIQQEEEAAAKKARPLRGTWQEEEDIMTNVVTKNRYNGNDQNTNDNHNKDQERTRYDSDSGSDSGNNHSSDSYDDDKDHSSSRPRKRHDSDDDDAGDVEPKHASKDTRRQRHDSDSESESDDHQRDRRRVARHDSDSSSQEGDPEKRLRHDSDNSNSSSSSTPAPNKTASGHKAGLQQGQQFSRAEAKLQAQQKQVVEQMVEQHGMGETVFRDDQGRRKNETTAAPSKEELEQRQKHQRWLLNQGSAQRQAAHDAFMERQELAQSSFARRAEDVDLEEIRKRELRDGDPMTQYNTTTAPTKTSSNKVGSSTTSANSGKKPDYKGPPAPPNRYGIKPGYRWDGHHRGNNFERQLLSLEFAKKHEKEQAYRYSSADM